MPDDWKCICCQPPPLHEVIEARNWHGTIERRIMVTREDRFRIEWWDFTHWRPVSNAVNGGPERG